MIPFSRILKYGNVVDRNTILDIDFSRQTVGQQNVIDWTGNCVFTSTRGSLGTVQFSTELQKNVFVMANWGKYFSPNALGLNTISYQLEIKYKKLTADNKAVMFGTGMWGNIRRIPGMAMTDLPGTDGMYYWLDNGVNATSFQRNYFTGVSTNQWETMVITNRRSTLPNPGITVYRQSNNTTRTYPAYSGEGVGEGIFIGNIESHSPENTNAFLGSIAYIKITRITA